MDQLEAHQRAQDDFARVLVSVRPDQLDLPTPCDEWAVRDVVAHVIGGNGWVQVRAGLEPAPLPDDPADLVGAHAASAAAAQAVFSAPDGLTRTFELPFGTVPGSVFASIRTGDVLTHTWDLAKATKQDTDVDPELAVEILETVRAFLVPSLRGPGKAFGEEQPCPEGASNADALAAFFGRVV